MERSHQLIDQVYTAALDSAGWPRVQENLEQLFDCIASGINTVRPAQGKTSLVKLSAIDAALLDCYIERFLYNTPWLDIPALQRQGYLRTDRALASHYRKPGY